MTAATTRAIEERYGGLAESCCSLSCGTAVDLVDAKPGEICVDLGSGRGNDVIRLAEAVAPNGHAYGIDVAEAMLDKARRTADKLGVANATFLHAELEHLPFADDAADWVISNCVLNHAGDKEAAWREIARVLRPGGRFVVSDIYAVDDIPAEYRNDPAYVAECWAGAVSRAEYLAHVRGAGLVDVAITGESAPYGKGKARVASFTISGRKCNHDKRGEPPDEKSDQENQAHAAGAKRLLRAEGRREGRAVLREGLEGGRGLPRLNLNLAGSSARSGPRDPLTTKTTMELSRYNILAPIHDDARYVLVNLLSGNADVLEPELGARLARGEVVDDPELAAKGYVVNPADEQRRYRAAYLAFNDSRLTDEVQLFYVPTYACNFGCSYCFQDEYAPPPPADDGAEVLDAFFAYVDETFARRRKYVTLFGGEPLLSSPRARAFVTRMVEQTAKRGLDLAVVTNGFDLESYVPILARGRIREIQVTLDGTEKIHDARRYLKGGGATFQRVVAGVDAALAAGMPINLRSVVDRDNVESFGELAHFAIDRGWTDDPRFKTQIGRNYELHHCQAGRARIYTRLSLYEDLYRLAERDPEILRFHRPTFSISRFLFDNGELPAPLFDACPACKTEWAFDYTGRIYPCTANVGKEGEAVGHFWPTRELDPDCVEPWQDRDVLAIPACTTCSVRLACGGGCGAVAKNQTGTVTAPDCRPIKELLSLGCSLYGRDSSS